MARIEGFRPEEDIHEGELQIGDRWPHARERLRECTGPGEIARHGRRESYSDPATVSGGRVPQDTAPGDFCNGGLDPLATIEIVPDVLINQAGREHVQYHSEIALRRGQKMGEAARAS
jgi:hypothetical protein